MNQDRRRGDRRGLSRRKNLLRRLRTRRSGQDRRVHRSPRKIEVEKRLEERRQEDRREDERRGALPGGVDISGN
ncbi:MAG TPA: hypothetical protein VGB26_04915 [Nitrospiria bacterium]